jgi:hypothetical protein
MICKAQLTRPRKNLQSALIELKYITVVVFELFPNWWILAVERFEIQEAW